MLPTTPPTPRPRPVPLPLVPILPPSHYVIGGLPSPTTPFPDAVIRLHYLLCPSPPTHFYYDLRTPPSSIIFGSTHTPCALDVPATTPPQHIMRIILPTDPHRPVIVTSSALGGITVGDVLESLYRFLRTPLTVSVGDGLDGPYVAGGDGGINIGLGLSHSRSAGLKYASRASHPPKPFHRHHGGTHQLGPETSLPTRTRSHDHHADVRDMGATRKIGRLGRRTVFGGLEVKEGRENGWWVLRTRETREWAKDYHEGQRGDVEDDGQEEGEEGGEEEGPSLDWDDPGGAYEDTEEETA